MFRGRLALLIGLLAVSTSGPFFVMARVSAYAAVFWRTLLAGLIALALAAVRGRLDPGALRMHGRELLLGGGLLGLHFILWVRAFELTDYASNLLLLVAQPLLAALLGGLLGEALPRHAGLTLLLAGAGMTLVAGGDIGLGPRALLGDLLCVLAGGAIAVFFVVSRRARSALPIEVFMGATLMAAAAVALPVALVAGVPLWGFPPESWLWLLGIVLFTTLAGHGLMNLAARSLPLFVVNIVVVLEPMIAIGMGALLFGARVSALQCVGGSLLAAAVILGMRGIPEGHAPVSHPAE